ncbi:MAG: acyltransferase family protein [Geminicoccaceae bacterium]
MSGRRHLWPDLAKGLCILLVVYGHAVVGVHVDQPIESELHDLLLKPFSQFRMPLFFFVSGLFAAVAARREWPAFVERTLLQLVWIFVLWNVLQYAARMAFAAWANTPIDPLQIVRFPIDPINVTWFIWALILYNLAARFMRGRRLWLLLVISLGLTIQPLEGLSYAATQSSRFLFFFVLGLVLSEPLLARPLKVAGRSVALLLPAYLLTAAWFSHTGLEDHPALALMLRLFGVISALATCIWAANAGRLSWLVRLGRHTLPIFVTHTIVTAGVREGLLRTGLADNALILVVTAWTAGIVLPLLFHGVMMRIGIRWLFDRPAWFHLRLRERVAQGLPTALPPSLAP